MYGGLIRMDLASACIPPALNPHFWRESFVRADRHSNPGHRVNVPGMKPA